MFFKGMIVGLFVGVMLGFLVAGLMVAAREAECVGEDEGAMMADMKAGIDRLLGDAKQINRDITDIVKNHGSMIDGGEWNAGARNTRARHAVPLRHEGSIDKEDSHG